MIVFSFLQLPDDGMAGKKARPASQELRPNESLLSWGKGRVGKEGEREEGRVGKEGEREEGRQGKEGGEGGREKRRGGEKVKRKEERIGKERKERKGKRRNGRGDDITRKSSIGYWTDNWCCWC